MKEKIIIDIVSDVACPWCFIGKKHIEAAMEASEEFDFEVQWHPFMLDPNIPSEGSNFDAYFSKKFGSMAQFEKISERVVQAGQNAGINFRFDQIPKVPNTLALHKILHIASIEGIANEVKGRFLNAYFENPIDLTSQQNICDIMFEFGWDEKKTIDILDDDAITQKVLIEIKDYQQMGVNAVPFFIINHTYGMSGAQPVEYFKEAFKDISIQMQANSDSSCDIDDPNC
ncbi:MAG TPA: DsbA family oxidoreductase [Saprospiraceae bacterium]|nr:DsbA family oxidoreductase [Saprospiraceae bacterium]HPN70080.1 DsbA family oxidoreductase [Saprospiraceae bacterium]